MGKSLWPFGHFQNLKKMSEWLIYKNMCLTPTLKIMLMKSTSADSISMRETFYLQNNVRNVTGFLVR